MRGRFTLELRATGAFGVDQQVVRAFGERLTATPTARVVQPTGLFVQPSNAGTFERADFDAVGEVTVNIGCRVSCHLDLFAGYTFLAWANPIRSGDQIDPVINPAQVTGQTMSPRRPGIAFREDFFWAQGANIGLNIHW